MDGLRPARLAEDSSKHLADEADWKRHLERLGIEKDRHVRIATEGALLGSVLHHGFSKELVIVSDDAGQFNTFRHALPRHVRQPEEDLPETGRILLELSHRPRFKCQ